MLQPELNCHLIKTLATFLSYFVEPFDHLELKGSTMAYESDTVFKGQGHSRVCV